MPIRVIPATENILVSSIVLCLYGPPGLGKTSLGFSADKPLVLDFDNGSYRAVGRKDVVAVPDWAAVASLDAADLAPYKTIVIDTFGRALDKMSEDIMANDAKARSPGGGLSLPGFGILKARAAQWLKFLRGTGRDLVLVCHSDEQRQGDVTIERLDAQGASRQEVYKVADAMGRLSLVKGRRTLLFDPTDAAFGKNPAQLPPLDVPDYAANPHMLADVITTIKNHLNSLSDAQRLEAKRLDDLRATFAGLKTPDEFTKAARDMASAPQREKAVLTAAARALGFKYDRKSGAFMGPTPVADAVAAAEAAGPEAPGLED